MKRKIILALTLSALLLSGCENKTELVDDIQTTSEKPSPQTVQGGTEFVEPTEETRYNFGGETEAANNTEDTESTQNLEIAETEGRHISGISQRLFDFGSLNPETEGEENTIGNYFVRDNIFCIDYSILSPDRMSYSYQLRFYDINGNRLLKTIDVPANYELMEFVELSGDALYKVLLYNSVLDEESGEYITESAVMTVNNDLSYDIAESDSEPYFPIECCGHNIKEQIPDIIDADSGEVLVAGKAAEDGDEFGGTRQMYYFPVDENRFVYRTLANESLPSFGIYDFSTGTAADVPESRDLIPLGVHRGKIYSVKTAWDGFGTELYVTDTDTLETEFFMDFPDEVKMNDYISYAMPENGDFIAMKYQPYDEDKPAVLYAIDPDTKEYFTEDIPESLRFYSLKRSSGGNVIISNNYDRVLVVGVEKD